MYNEGFCNYTIAHGCKAIQVVPLAEDKADYAVAQPSFDEACHAIGEKFFKNARALLIQYELRKKKVIDAAKKLSRLAGKVPDQTLLRLYREYWSISEGFEPYMMFPHYMERELEPWAKTKFPEAFEILAANDTPFEHMKMQRMLFTASPARVAKEYGWSSVNGMTETPFDAVYFSHLKKQLKKKEIQRRFEELGIAKRAFAQFIKHITGEDAVRCLVFHRFVFIRTDRIDAWKKHAAIMYPFALYVGHKIDASLSIREASMLSCKEIVAILEGKQGPSAQEMLKRGTRRLAMTIYTPQGTSSTTDSMRIATVRKAYQKKVGLDMVKGMPACKGLVKGVVKIYLHKSDMSPNDAGYVLVCRHTSPQDLMYMKKAIAIVTDEGGVTSHAAIVSRELGIPCVVGTKHAIDVFKTGDLVEVDANSGVVRRI